MVLGGVQVETTRGVEATSDGDVVAHAVADALLGASSLGDLGSHFPSEDPRWHGADSMEILRVTMGLLTTAGWRVVHADVTVVAQTVRVAPHRDAIRQALGAVLAVDPAAISVKATTTDHMGFIGRDEGIAALAAVTVATIH